VEALTGERLRGKDAGLVESNGSLLSGDNLKSHVRADCLYTGISSGLNARYRGWENYLFTLVIGYNRNVSKIANYLRYELHNATGILLVCFTYFVFFNLCIIILLFSTNKPIQNYVSREHSKE